MGSSTGALIFLASAGVEAAPTTRAAAPSRVTIADVVLMAADAIDPSLNSVYATHTLPVNGRTHGKPPPCESPKTRQITLKEALLFDQQKPSNHLTPPVSIRFARSSREPQKKSRDFRNLPAPVRIFFVWAAWGLGELAANKLPAVSLSQHSELAVRAGFLPAPGPQKRLRRLRALNTRMSRPD